MEVLVCDHCGKPAKDIRTVCMMAFQRHFDPITREQGPRCVTLNVDGQIQVDYGVISFEDMVDLCEKCLTSAVLSLSMLKRVETVESKMINF
jgi:hypothetical protein